MKSFGLIGKKLSHSFSKHYFENKFEALNLKNYHYKLFEFSEIDKISEIFENESINGLNVTIPFKEAVIPYLDKLDKSARKVGAVNVIKIKDGIKTGYNSDFYGFKVSLNSWLNTKNNTALVLGSGGASKAVTAVLRELKIPFAIVSRDNQKGDLTYKQLKNNTDFISQHNLIINTTPLGMYPDLSTSPDIPYKALSGRHYLYDLVYNPEKTLFLTKGEQQGCKIKNGMEMLELQAEKSWEIWINIDTTP